MEKVSRKGKGAKIATFTLCKFYKYNTCARTSRLQAWRMELAAIVIACFNLLLIIHHKGHEAHEAKLGRV